METIQAYLSEVKDFRIEKKGLHKLSDIPLIGLFTYLSSGEDYEDMALFARTHKEFLQPYVSLPMVYRRTIPSVGYFQCWSRKYCGSV
jgi:hypothetical protein